MRLPTGGESGPAVPFAGKIGEVMSKPKTASLAERCDRVDAWLNARDSRARAVHWDSRRKVFPDGKTAILSTPWEVRWLDAITGQVLKNWPLPKGRIVCGFSDGERCTVFV